MSTVDNGNGQAGGVPALGDDGAPGPGSNRTGPIVATVILGLLVVLMIYAFSGTPDERMVDRSPEEFRLRAAGRGPQDPGPATAQNFGESDIDAERRRRAEEEREAQRRAEQAAIDAQRLAMAQQYDTRERDAEAAEAKRAAEQERRRKEQEYRKRLRSGISIASTSSNAGSVGQPGAEGAQGAPGAAGTGPAVNGSDPFSRDRAAADSAVAANAGQSPESFAFLPAARSSKFDRTAAAFGGFQDMRIAPGRLIRGVLETAISTDQPGGIRAIVSEDVYSEDGQRVLIPKMSRLWGEYRATVISGQKRVGVIWSRLIRPDGVDVALRGIGTDALGTSGLEGDVDTKFWTRFGGAILQSMLEVAEERASDDQDIQIVAGDTQTAASVALQQAQNVAPTIYVDQGTTINVLVANDLDFRDVTLLGFSQ